MICHKRHERGTTGDSQFKDELGVGIGPSQARVYHA